MAIIPTGNIYGRSQEMTEQEHYMVQGLFMKYGHGPVLDLVASIIEPHPAETEDMPNVRRAFANTIRGLAINLPDVRY